MALQDLSFATPKRKALKLPAVFHG